MNRAKDRNGYIYPPHTPLLLIFPLTSSLSAIRGLTRIDQICLQPTTYLKIACKAYLQLIVRSEASSYPPETCPGINPQLGWICCGQTSLVCWWHSSLPPMFNFKWRSYSSIRRKLHVEMSTLLESSIQEISLNREITINPWETITPSLVQFLFFPAGPGVQLVTSDEGEVVAVHMSQAETELSLNGSNWGGSWNRGTPKPSKTRPF